MKVLVTGVSGQLGQDVMAELIKRKYECIGTGNAEAYQGEVEIPEKNLFSYIPMDITDQAEVNEVIERVRPDAVIHCAAWTAVDLAEEEENRKKVEDTNAAGTEHIAAACRKVGCKILYLSTDYVFNGEGSEPWSPDCKDFQPLSVYGKTKLEGEYAVARNTDQYFIVRIAWVFGRHGKNFVYTMLRLGSRLDAIKVVSDQIGTPTYTYDAARLLVDMVETEKYGTYHVTNEGGYISWYEFACEIFQEASRLGHSEYDSEHLRVEPVTTADYTAAKAKRPFNSRLEKSKLAECGFEPLPTWQDALRRFIEGVDFGAFI